MTVIEAQAPVATGRDVEELLRAGGFSRFHRKAVLVTGAAWTFVAMEILLVGFVQTIFTAKWNLNGTWAGLINSSALAGSLFGRLVLGRLADRLASPPPPARPCGPARRRRPHPAHSRGAARPDGGHQPPRRTRRHRGGRPDAFGAPRVLHACARAHRRDDDRRLGRAQHLLL